MSRVRVRLDGRAGAPGAVEVETAPPLGWRFWSLAGFPGDPIEPRPYGGSRCVTLAPLDLPGGFRWVCAMEADDTVQLLLPHELFPAADQVGADAFAARWLRSHMTQPDLFGG